MNTRDLIVNLDVSAEPLPAANAGAQPAGFRITIIAPSGTAGAPVMTTETIVRFSSLAVGSTYTLRAESITSTGQAIGLPVEVAVLVAAAVTGTYSKIAGIRCELV